MEYRPIDTQRQYEFVARRIEQLQHAAPHAPEADELKILTELIVDYELRMAASDDKPSGASAPASPA
ncbi:hypothetical protein [Pontibacter chitinilyticus]|uniref:hypothetical protein n=1 Tax=Pontibacter chitinilyticus TaxID=2674989 RepID=UPI00321AEC65